MASVGREVRRLMGQAIYHYNLMEQGDSIAVGVSGGKDSMLLLWLLRERLARAPIDYELTAVYVDPGFGGETADRLEEFFRKEAFRYAILRTDHGVLAHSPINRENPCFLCSRLRRMALFRKAGELGCSKIALGHNQDDFIETFFINICYGGQTAAIKPRQTFFEGEMTVIRPLALVASEKIERLGQEIGFPILKSCCPSLNRNKRQEMRDMLESLYSRNPKVRGNIFHAMSHVNAEYLPPPLKIRRGRDPFTKDP